MSSAKTAAFLRGKPGQRGASYLPDAPISGDELAARLYAEQGFLVMTSDNPYQIGDISADGYHPGHSRIHVPLRIVGPSNLSEHAAQQVVKKRLGVPPAPGLSYFYRVEAAD